MAPAFVILCNIVEGQLVTPLIVGRRLEINAVAIFIAVAFWSWLWGFVGALIAVPLLVIIKVFCDHFDSWRHVGNFLSAHQGPEAAETEAETPASQASIVSPGDPLAQRRGSIAGACRPSYISASQTRSAITGRSPMAVLSVLDLSPVPEGSTAGQSLKNTLDLARHAERLGYNRYWLAEHHNMPGIASAATSVVIGHVAAGTSTIRVGAGGIMLPNHAPLVIAEQFGTLAALHPGRIDLGLGRAPGTDMLTARALRRNLEAGVDNFPQDVVELMNYFRRPSPASACARCRAKARTSRSGCSAHRPMARSSPPCSACPTLSPRISRRPKWSMRSTSTARASSPRNAWRSRD